VAGADERERFAIPDHWAERSVQILPRSPAAAKIFHKERILGNVVFRDLFGDAVDQLLAKVEPIVCAQHSVFTLLTPVIHLFINLRTRNAESFPFSMPHSKSPQGSRFSRPYFFSTFAAAVRALSHTSR
jgi:hypothetical protein